MSALSRGRRPLLVVAAAGALLGAVVALRYAALDLTLSHYDARGHIVVSRRIFDSITPGWQQIGAVWLPLPHLLNALPVQIDLLYRTGASAVALSVLAFAVATAAIAWIVASLTRSWLAGVAGLTVFALNPNVLYLQATPMTEPLLIASTTGAIALLLAYCSRIADEHAPGLQGRDQRALPAAIVGWTFGLACLTRYEAWPVTIGALGAAIWVLWRQGLSVSHAIRAVGRVAIFPLAAIAAFTVFSKVVVGDWFASGFFVPENPAQGQPLEAVSEIVWGLRELSGTAMMLVAAAGALLLLGASLARKARASDILPLALIGTAAVPWSAFVDGHPYRIRYMVPLIAAQAICAGVAVGRWRRGRVVLSLALMALAAFELRPLNLSAPLVVEAQWDRPNAPGRAIVTTCLRDSYRGETIMASMGSLGHYMQDVSKAGFAIRDFLHEGNGDIWLNALNAPRPFAGWILIEEKAEGGDMLAAIARENPQFLDGYARVCEGAGLALYRRMD
ncbi:MAG TPA: hypothetical protein VM032_16985 [Vicinamibacterales bacterium]|nr:hypothetical protein [Vicinamibacterales bacterium]